MPAPIDDDVKQRILDLFSEGKSGTAIADELGVASSTVYKVKNEAGASPKKRKARGSADGRARVDENDAASPPPRDAEMPECTDCIALYERVGRLVVENERLKRILAGR